MTDIVDQAAIAERLSVTKDAVKKWRLRHPDFPRPTANLAMGPVWVWRDVHRWAVLTNRVTPTE